jgi:hypothetical protein
LRTIDGVKGIPVDSLIEEETIVTIELFPEHIEVAFGCVIGIWSDESIA